MKWCKCECCSLEEITAAPAVEAKQRIPADLKGNSFFSSLDLYQYIAITDDRTCKQCLVYDKMILQGDYIRSYYPYLEIISQNQMLPHVHKNCRCALLRVTDLSDYITYTEPIPDFPSQKYTEPHILPDYKTGTSRKTTLDDI